MTPAPVHNSTSVIRFRTTLSSLCAAAILVACGSSSDNKPGTGSANIILKNENNYKSSSTLILTNVDTAPGQDGDIDICWTGLTKDLQCHDVAPSTDIKNISLVQFINKSHEQAQGELISGTLTQSDLVYREFNTPGGTTCTKLSSFKGLGSGGALINLAEDYVENSADTYVIIASDTTTVAAGARSMVFVTPKAGISNKAVDIPSGCEKLNFHANLHELTKVSVSAKGPWVADWSQVTKDSEGNDPNLVTKDYDLILGHYDKTISEMESDFFNIETTATKLWRIKKLDGSTTTSKNLGQAQAEDGSLFTGFEPAGGIWALGLQCPECQNPAPMFLTILEPGDA